MTNITTATTFEKEKQAKEKEVEDTADNYRGFLDRKQQRYKLIILHSLALVANCKVKLVSSEGHSFTLDYDCVIQSGTIKSLLESSSSNFNIN